MLARICKMTMRIFLIVLFLARKNFERYYWAWRTRPYVAKFVKSFLNYDSAILGVWARKAGAEVVMLPDTICKITCEKNVIVLSLAKKNWRGIIGHIDMCCHLFALVSGAHEPNETLSRAHLDQQNTLWHLDKTRKIVKMSIAMYIRGKKPTGFPLLP